MVGIAEAGAAISGIRAAYDLAKGIQALSADVSVKLATIDLMESILNAQKSAVEAMETQTRMQKRIAELEAEIAGNKNWQGEQARYELVIFPSGSAVYVLRATASNGEAIHRLCPVCFQKGKKSILQTYAKHSGGEIVSCLPCGKEITLANFNAPLHYGEGDRGITGY